MTQTIQVLLLACRVALLMVPAVRSAAACTLRSNTTSPALLLYALRYCCAGPCIEAGQGEQRGCASEAKGGEGQSNRHR